MLVEKIKADYSDAHFRKCLLIASRYLVKVGEKPIHVFDTLKPIECIPKDSECRVALHAYEKGTNE